MFLRTAGKIAFRDLLATPGKFVFVIAAVAVGVAALSGIKGFGTAFKSTLLHNAKQLIAADVQAQTWNNPSAEQLLKLQSLGSHFGVLTQVTETVSMAGSTRQRFPQLVSVKAVDPALYPLYGTLSTQPAKPLRLLLSNDSSALVTPELLIRMRVRPGEVVRIGGKDFTITGTLVGEPDRLASGFGPGMRVLISRAGLDRSGLIGFGSRAAQRFLFKLRPGADVDRLKDQVKASLPRVFLSDYREGSPIVGEAIDRTTTFLSLISLIALIVGALGVGMSIHTHIQHHLDTIGIMKALGGRSIQVLQIYLTQTIGLALIGSAIGITIGFLVQRSFPLLMKQIFSQLPAITADYSFIGPSILLGLFSALLFTLPPLLRIRHISPNLVFRRNMQDGGSADRPIWQQRASTMAVYAFIAAGFIAMASWVAGSLRIGLYFAAGLAASILLLSGAAAILLFTLRRSARSFRTLPSSLRQGIANLYRPGNRARDALVAVGIGVMFTLTTFLIQNTILREITKEAPASQGNVFLLDIRDTAGVSKLVNGQPGVTGKLELVGYIVARMLTNNGVAMAKLGLSKQRKDQAEAVRLLTATHLPQGLRVEHGAWWPPQASSLQLAVSNNSARNYHLKLGDRVKFQAAYQILEAPVVALFEADPKATVRYDLVLPRQSLVKLPVVFYGTVHADAKAIPALEETLFEQYPTVTVMNLADILKRIQEAVDQVALVIRFLAFFAILAGLIILGSSIASTRQGRIREIAILKTLGATRRVLQSIFSVEFSALGLVAGTIGALLANVFTKIIAVRLIDTSFDFDWRSFALTILLTVLLTNLAGWAASLRILDQKPSQVLRGE